MSEKCSPVVMRKNLETVELFKSAGIDFVAVPVLNGSQKDILLSLAADVLSVMEAESRQDEQS